MTDTDEALLASLKRGDRGAFRELYGRHKDAMLRIASRVLSNRADAEDAVQEAFLSVYRSAGLFDGRSAFTTWFYRIVVNASLKLRRARPRSVPLPEGVEPEETVPSAARERAEGREEVLLIDGAIRALPLRQRIAFTLVAVEGFSRAEAAGVMGVDAGTVRYHLFAAREGLRKRLGPLLGRTEETTDAVR